MDQPAISTCSPGGQGLSLHSNPVQDNEKGSEVDEFFPLKKLGKFKV